MRILPVILISVLVSACAINQEVMKKTNLIEKGMTQGKVSELLGPPGNKQFNDNQEAWQYCQTTVVGKTDKFTVVWFNNETVTGVTHYTRSDYTGLCENHFRSVNWEGTPSLH